MKTVATLLSFLFQVILASGQTDRKMNEDDSLQFSQLTFIKMRGYNQLPREVKRELNKAVEGRFRITMKEKRFGRTDVHIGLIPDIERKESFVGRNDNVYMIAYEHGGQALHCHVVFAKKEISGRIVIYNYVSGVKIEDSESFQFWLLQNQFFRQTSGDM